VASDRQLVVRHVDRGDVEVDEEVVQADGRDRVAQGLERHGMVAHGKLKLFRRDVWAFDETAGLPRLRHLRHLDLGSLEPVDSTLPAFY